MPSVSRLVFAALALIVVAAPFAHADRCVGAKLRAIGKKEYGLFTCQAKVAANGNSSGLAACESNVRAKFSMAFANAGSCSGDQTRCENMADACVAAVAALLTEPFPSACEAAKRKAAAKSVKKELGCYARAARRGLSVDLTCIAKARDRFAVALTKAGTCPDGGSTQTEVESNCVQPVVGSDLVIEVCPTSTTSTTTSTSTTTMPPFPCDNPGGSCGSCGNGFCQRSCDSPEVGTCIDRTPIPPCVTDEDCAAFPGRTCFEGQCRPQFGCSLADQDCPAGTTCVGNRICVFSCGCLTACLTPCP